MSDDMGSTSGTETGPDGHLERRYRRWMAAYPMAYRADREDELVGVLLDAAAPGQLRPRPAEVLDLLRAGATVRFTRFRDSPRRGAWEEAGAVIGVMLAVVLCVAVTVPATYGLQFAMGMDFSRFAIRTDSWVFHGWYAPALWLAVVVLLVAKAARPAMVVAWVAVAAQVVAIVTAPTPSLAWVSRSSDAQLVLGLVAALLLSRPASVRRAVDRMGRWWLAIGATAVFVACLAGRVLRGAPSDFLLVGALALGAVVMHLVRGSTGERRLDPVVRRVLLALVALIPMLLVLGSGIRQSRSPRSISGIAGGLALNVGVVLIPLLLLVAVVAAARRVPFRVVRRTAPVDASER